MWFQLFGAGPQLISLGLPRGSLRLTSGSDFASQQYTGHRVGKLCLPRALRTFVIALVTISSLQPTAKAQVKETRRVLILNELGPASPAINLIDGEIRTRLERSPYQIELYTESLETTLFPDPAIQKEFFDSYIRKYRDHKPDVIIAVGPTPVYFLVQSHEKFFADIPVVFCVTTPEMVGNPTVDSSFTGVWEMPDFTKTLEVALKLLPSTRHIVVVGGVSPYDRANEAIIKDGLRRYETRFDVTYLTDLDMPTLLERLMRLPENSIILQAGISEDAAGTRYIVATQSDPMIAQAANAPVFPAGDMADVDVGHGAIGGYVTSFTKEGEIAAEDADRILNGAKPKDIPIVRGANAYIFDLRALQHWGLKESNLPPGSIVLNRQPSLWKSFRWYVIGGMTVILVEALLISGLLWQRIRRKAAETKLIIANKQLADDITERKLAQEALAGMSRKLLDAQEQERARIGRELHDDINQRLALLSVEIDGMKEVSPVINGELRSRMDELGKRTSEISAVVQSLSHELHSSKLEYVGVVLAMKGFCKEFGEHYKVEVAFVSEGMPPIVPPDISVCLFRVMQEGLQNALKHSGVKLFDVMLLGSPAEIRLTVRDLGKGFDPELAKDTPGLGLVSMQERVRLVKGTISISSRPLSGTEINVRVPLQAGVQTEQAKMAGA